MTVQIIISLVIGLVIALIVTGVMKSKMHNVHLGSEANEYADYQSLDLTVKQDRFLYKNVTKTPIPKDKK